MRAWLHTGREVQKSWLGMRMAWTSKLFWDTVFLSCVVILTALAATFLSLLQWLPASCTPKCWYPSGLSPHIATLTSSRSLPSDLIHTNGFKCHLDTDKLQIYATSQDSPLTSRLIYSTRPPYLSIWMFNRYLQLSTGTLSSWFSWICYIPFFHVSNDNSNLVVTWLQFCNHPQHFSFSQTPRKPSANTSDSAFRRDVEYELFLSFLMLSIWLKPWSPWTEILQ